MTTKVDLVPSGITVRTDPVQQRSAERISLLLERFSCKNRAELVAYCYVHGYLSVLAWPPCRCQCAHREPISSRNTSSGGG